MQFINNLNWPRFMALWTCHDRWSFTNESWLPAMMTKIMVTNNKNGGLLIVQYQQCTTIMVAKCFHGQEQGFIAMNDGQSWPPYGPPSRGRRPSSALPSRRGRWIARTETSCDLLPMGTHGTGVICEWSHGRMVNHQLQLLKYLAAYDLYLPSMVYMSAGTLRSHHENQAGFSFHCRMIKQLAW